MNVRHRYLAFNINYLLIIDITCHSWEEIAGRFKAYFILTGYVAAYSLHNHSFSNVERRDHTSFHVCLSTGVLKTKKGYVVTNPKNRIVVIGHQAITKKL